MPTRPDLCAASRTSIKPEISTPRTADRRQDTTNVPTLLPTTPSLHADEQLPEVERTNEVELPNDIEQSHRGSLLHVDESSRKLTTAIEDSRIQRSSSRQSLEPSESAADDALLASDVGEPRRMSSTAAQDSHHGVLKVEMGEPREISKSLHTQKHLVSSLHTTQRRFKRSTSSRVSSNPNPTPDPTLDQPNEHPLGLTSQNLKDLSHHHSPLPQTSDRPPKLSTTIESMPKSTSLHASDRSSQSSVHKADKAHLESSSRSEQLHDHPSPHVDQRLLQLSSTHVGSRLVDHSRRNDSRFLRR